MPLNVSEASAVNVLVDYLAGKRRHSGDHYSPMEARDALVKLVDGAHNKLGAGASAQDVARLFPQGLQR